jgi:glycosyltransferase involved in cell wall biosynthesis
MKVLLCHNYYQQAGGERVAVEAQVWLLRSRGHEVVLYTEDNTTIAEYGVRQKVGFFPGTVFSRRAYERVRKLARLERPDVTHVHNVFPLISPSVYLALDAEGIPIVQTVHNFRFLCPNGLFYTRGKVCERCKRGNTLHAVRWRCHRNSYLLSGLYALTIGLHRRLGTFDRISRFIAPTEFVAQKLSESGLVSPRKVSVLGHFLPSPLPEPAFSNQRNRYVVFLGRLSAEKGLWTLVAAFKDLPDVGLKILGDGPLVGALRNYVRRYGLENVEIPGFVVGEDRFRVLRHAVASVVPSEWHEVFPFSALESLAVGTPVIASDAGSLPYLIEDGQNGLIFEAGNSNDLREKVLSLANDPDKAVMLGRRGRRLVEHKYSPSAHYHALMKIYAECFGGEVFVKPIKC